MGTRKRYKVGEVVEFIFAGSKEKGTVLSADKDGKYVIADSKYTYPVDFSKILNISK